MGFINIFLGTDDFLRVKNRQLIVREGESFPIEDVNCVMIDNLRAGLTTYTLNELIASGATVILCDEKHTPANVVLPFQGYYRRLSTLQSQTDISKPRVKRLWQSIVKQKIKGQSACLRACGAETTADRLEQLANSVISNDGENREAEAARLYFPALFGNGFTRGEEGKVNAALNYSYAVVRSLLARHLCARGFECAYGIFHKNQFNAFNLADDMIEPFRPIADYFVKNTLSGAGDLTYEEKKKLFTIVNLEVDSGGQAHSLSNGVERMAESLLAYYKGERDDLVMPSLLAERQHTFL
jgi:CRISPR-associated protein Cas1